jgi:predicted ATPase
MRLTQNRIHKSIRSLGQVDLPAFTVLTGLNGSGKSHLLEAIRDGHVAVDIAPDRRRDIQHLTWNDLVPNDVGVTNLANVHQNRDWFVGQVRNRKAERTNNLLDILRNFGIDMQFASDPWGSLHLDQGGLAEAGVPQDRIAAALQDIDSFEQDLRASLRGNAGQDEEKLQLLNELVAGKTRFHNLEARDFNRRAFSYYGRNLFQHSFGQMFFAYFDKLRANGHRRMNESDGRESDTRSLTDEEFVEKNGPPPWDFVNSTLERARLDFRIDQPIDYEATEYLPKLTKISNGTNVQFGSLSSGEKIIMSFALCLYNSTDNRQQIVRPKVILFDEIDASLHPSMSRTLIDIINDVIVGKEGISVILVTHSPSTVAVSPEASIHLLEPLTNRITPESKRRAVATLTAEIPTMSIDFSGRRQVLVESDFDADRYGLLYQIVAPYIASERSLTFIGVGRSHDGSGSAKVMSTVTSLASAGNLSVFGLIDWDTANVSTNRVRVLGEGERYAIENYLLDPILVAAAVIEASPSDASKVGLRPSDTFASFSSLSAEVMQVASKLVQERILARHNKKPASPVAVKYWNDRVQTVDQEYLLMNGHVLEDTVRHEFPSLTRWNGTGKLLRHMIDVILRNHPSLAPKRLVEDLAWLCSAEAE